MKTITLLLRPKFFLALVKKLLPTIALSLAIMAPGFFLVMSGQLVLGTLALLAASFFMMARNYRKPWRWNPVSSLVPGVVALLGIGIQYLLMPERMPGFALLIPAVVGGVILGWQRASVHRLYLNEDKLMIERTFGFLLAWILCTGATQLCNLLSWNVLQQPTMAASIFSATMLATVSCSLFQKGRSFTKSQPSRQSRQVPSAALGAVIMLLILTPSSFAQDFAKSMNDVGKKSLNAAQKKSSGLYSQQFYFDQNSSGRTLTIDASFDIQSGDFVSDTQSKITFKKFNNQKDATKMGRSMIDDFRKKSGNQGIANQLRGNRSIHGPMKPQSGGTGHRALIQHGLWLIDVDTVAWDPGDAKNRRLLAQAQKNINVEFANQLFDNGVAAGLIDLDPELPPASTTSTARSTPTNTTATLTPSQNSIQPVRPQLEDISGWENGLDGGLSAEEIARATALITVILVLGGMSVDVAGLFASEIVQGMIDEFETQRDLNRELADLETEVNSIDRELQEEMPDLDGKPQPTQGTVPFYDPQVIVETLIGSGKDTAEILRELAELAPILGETAYQTALDLLAHHPVFGDALRAQEVEGKILAGGRFARNAVEAISQLAGDQYATRIDQDSDIQSVIELLSAAATGKDGEAVQLYGEQREQVLNGIRKIADMAGDGAVQLAMLSVGAEEWKRAMNGELSPLTRVTNALLGSAQLYGSLELVGKLGKAAGSKVLGEAGELQFRRNPVTDAFEFRQGNGRFQPVPDEIAARMRSPFEPKPPRPLATGRDAALRNLPDGAIIPDELMAQTGYAPDQVAALRELAKSEDVIFGARTTNMDSLQHIASGTGTPKPVTIKSKTIQELDTYLGASNKDVGLVGFFDPPPLEKIDFSKIPAKLHDQVKARHALRQGEYAKLLDEINSMEDVVNKNGKLYRVFEDGSSKPFAGDIDPVYIKDAKTGKPLSGQRYLQVLDKFKDSAAQIQHGAEFNMSMDVLRHLEPGTPKYEKAVEKMMELHKKLEASHLSGAEIVIEALPDGTIRRGAKQNWLGMEV